MIFSLANAGREGWGEVAVFCPRFMEKGRSRSIANNWFEMCAFGARIGYMLVPNKVHRGERLVARVSGSDKLLFRWAAALEGRSVATFVITHARDVARRIVAGLEAVKLDAAQSRRFVKALLNPVPPAPTRLKKAVAAYRQRVVA